MDKKNGLIAAALLLLAGAAHAQWKGFPYLDTSTVTFNGVSPFDWPMGKPDLSGNSFTAGKSFKQRTMSDLVDEVEPEKTYSRFKSLALYKGESAVNETFKLKVTEGSHWRVLWKVVITEKKEKTTFRMEIRSPSAPLYLQGINKDMIPVDEGAFGVVNICLTEGEDFTIGLDISTASWRVEAQRLD